MIFPLIYSCHSYWGTEFVTYDDVSFRGEVMCCNVCSTRLGYRYLQSDLSLRQFVMNYNRCLVPSDGLFIPYFIVESSQLRMMRRANAAAANEEAAEANEEY